MFVLLAQDYPTRLPCGEFLPESPRSRARNAEYVHYGRRGRVAARSEMMILLGENGSKVLQLSH
jgi:hypothetical protein